MSRYYELVEDPGNPNFLEELEGQTTSPYDSLPPGASLPSGSAGGGGNLVPVLHRTDDYSLDGVNNRLEVTGAGALLPGEYLMTGDDALMNRYTELPTAWGDEARELVYDANSNLVGYESVCIADMDGDHDIDEDDLYNHIGPALTAYWDNDPETEPDWNSDLDDDGVIDVDDFYLWNNNQGPCAFRELTYDFQNRLVVYRARGDEGEEIAEHRYAYDALGRRVRKHLFVANEGGTEQGVLLLYGGDSSWQLIEERAGLGTDPPVTATWVYSGLYIDDVVQMRRDVDADQTIEEYYYHADDLASVRAITDENGDVVEFYDYHEYGSPMIVDVSVGPTENPVIVADSTVGNPFMFTGRYHDGEMLLYEYRTRLYEPLSGVFTSSDSIGVWGDSTNYGNARAYAGSAPATWVDPFGLDSVGVYDCDDDGGSPGQQKKSRIKGIPCGSRIQKQAADDYDHVICARTPDELARKLRELKEELAKEGKTIDSVHIFDHGLPGLQELGDLGLIPGRDWQQITENIDPAGRICLHGCNVAEGEDGREYIDQLARDGNRQVDGFTGRTRISPVPNPFGRDHFNLGSPYSSSP